MLLPGSAVADTWTPPAVPVEPRFTPLDHLHVFDVHVVAPEDVLILQDGHVLTGVADGRILMLDPVEDTVTTVADTGGRPLGLEHHPDGGIVVCDAEKGLLLLRDGELSVLSDTLRGRPLRFVNNATVGPDGTIWFSISSTTRNIDDWWSEVVEEHPSGMLVQRDPDGTLTVLADHIAFANGVTLAPDGRSLIVTETARYLMHRYWLDGPRAGTVEQFGPDLTGFPVSVSTDHEGLIWLAVAAPRHPMLDWARRRGPWARKLALRLPEPVRPPPSMVIQVQAYDADGTLVHDLRGFHPDFAMTTGARRHGDTVWTGSITGATVARFAVPA